MTPLIPKFGLRSRNEYISKDIPENNMISHLCIFEIGNISRCEIKIEENGNISMVTNVKWAK